LLTFAGRERLAPFVHRRVESLGEAINEFTKSDDVDGGVDLFVGGVGLAETQVGADRTREEEGLLGHDAELRAQGAQRDGFDVDTVEQHPALVGS
jgi:hypothetical protein